MPVLILFLLSLIVIYSPQFWAKRVLSRYSKDQYFSGSGIELARTMLDRLNMSHVRVETIEQGDHYDPKEKVLRLSRNNCGGRSLTAVVVAAHEVGHAIQDPIRCKGNRDEPILPHITGIGRQAGLDVHVVEDAVGIVSQQWRRLDREGAQEQDCDDRGAVE